MSSDSGTLVARYRYDPWGKQTLVTGTNATDRGYTGHEMLDDGLVHMNGRVYDPLIARFISADPYVQDPGASQSYNRYSYLWDNPMTGADPSGYFRLFGKKWSWWRDTVVKPVVAAWVGYYAF